MQEYEASLEVPEVSEYLRLRLAAGLTARSERAAVAGLPQTAVGVVVRHDGGVVAMGRAIGDGLFYQIVGIAVEPAHQGRGLGKTIMAELLRELERLAPQRSMSA